MEDRSIVGLLPAEVERLVERWGEKPFRADQVLRWVHGHSVLDPGQMSNVPSALRARLSAELAPIGARVCDQAVSQDGTLKVRIELQDGGRVETVLIPEERKLTQCVSTQVGCAFRCAFCLSGARGLERSLRADEIVAQIHLVRGLRPQAAQRLTNIVVMGSGEPFANYDETARALRILTSPRGVGVSARRVTVSTVGLPKGIARLGRDFDGKVGLAVSLHGPDDETRSRLVPSSRRVRVATIIEALRAYPLPQRRRITIEYVLAAGINDEERHAAALVRLLRGIRVKVNLIPVNRHAATDLQPPPPEVVERFRQVLVAADLTAISRRQRGADIGAACGQLLHAKGT